MSRVTAKMGGFGGNPGGNGSGGASAQHRGRAENWQDDGRQADRSGLHAKDPAGQEISKPAAPRPRRRVKACVMAALNAANGRANVAVAIPTEAAPKVSAGSALPAGFVAPPRTITDITAILDSEKPDLKTIEELKAEADSQPGGSRAKT